MSQRVEDAFAPAQDTIDWAEDAIRELNASAVAFFQGDIAAVITEQDPQTGENVQKLRLTQALPRIFRRRATEALTQAKVALDQATFAVRNLSSGPSRKSIYFPWAENPTDLERLLIAREIDQRFWETISAHEPYPRSEGHAGGDDVIRALAAIANNKHTIGLMVGGHISSTSFPSIVGREVQSMSISAPRWDPLKNEAELLRWVGDVKVDGDYRFAFEVLLKEPRLTQPVNLVDGLGAFASKAKAVTKDLKARCIELGL